MESENRGTFGKLSQRASALAETVAGRGKDRSFWTKPIIDELAESALVLDEKAKKEEKTPEEQAAWDQTIAKIMAALAFWRGDFKLSWSCALGAIEFSKSGSASEESKSDHEIKIIAGLAASHYARFEAIDDVRRDLAFRFAEGIFAELLADERRFSKELRAEVFFAAGRHWQLADLEELARFSILRAVAEDPLLARKSLEFDAAPEFWREMHFKGPWLTLLESIMG